MRPRENMQRVAEFLGVEYQDRMLEGPVFNPWYPEEGMNEEKVNRSRKEKIDFKLETQFPFVYNEYLELLALSRTTATTPVRRIQSG